jgi:hypothetical protein
MCQSTAILVVLPKNKQAGKIGPCWTMVGTYQELQEFCQCQNKLSLIHEFMLFLQRALGDKLK